MCQPLRRLTQRGIAEGGVHGHIASLSNSVRSASRARYSVVLPERSTALVWIDEDTGAVFLLTGGLEEDILVRIAESMYETGGETA